MNQKVLWGLGICFVLVGVLLGRYLLPKQEKPSPFRGVNVTNEYQATTTAASTVYGNTITGDNLVKTGLGAFGSVVITGATAGVVNVYDATTTNVLLRTGNKATSTILIVSLPASLAAGTYTFDHEFTDGLYVDLVAGTMPTTTITYR